jgi:hypothetical protein
MPKKAKMLLDKKEVIDLVKKAIKTQLDIHPDFKSRISVYPKSVRKSEDDWWYVGVYPDADLKTVYYYYDILAQVGGKLQDDDGLNIQLIPVRPRN